MHFETTDRRALATLIGISMLLFFVDLGGRDIWDIDEGMHAAIAVNMLQSGDWVTPIFNGEAFLDKPPLFNWLTAVAFKLFGVNGFAARLPAALAALGSVLLCYGIGRALYSRRAGLLAGVVLATSLEFTMIARVVQYDVPFTLFTTLAIFAYILAVQQDRAAHGHWVVFYVALALAVLTKGPLGIVLVGTGVVAHLVATRNPRTLRRLLNPIGILAFCIIAVPWFVLMEQANPGYIDYFVIRQHVGNLLGAGGDYIARHPEPLYYYIPVFLGTMLPWSLVMPQAVYSALKHRDARVAKADILLVAFFAGSLLVLSVATSKLATYVLPLMPVAAVLIGRYWDRLFDARPETRKLGQVVAFAGLFTIFVDLATHTMINQPFTHWDARTGIAQGDFVVFLLGFSALWLVASVFAVLAKQRSSFVTLSLIAPFMCGFILWVLSPRADDYRGSKAIAEMIDERLAADEPIYLYGRLLDSAMFYTNRDSVLLETEAALHDYMADEERVFVLVRTRSGFWDEVPRDDYHVLATVANKAIISNQADKTGSGTIN